MNDGSEYSMHWVLIRTFWMKWKAMKNEKKKNRIRRKKGKGAWLLGLWDYQYQFSGFTVSMYNVYAQSVFFACICPICTGMPFICDSIILANLFKGHFYSSHSILLLSFFYDFCDKNGNRCHKFLWCFFEFYTSNTRKGGFVCHIISGIKKGINPYHLYVTCAGFVHKWNKISFNFCSWSVVHSNRPLNPYTILKLFSTFCNFVH